MSSKSRSDADYLLFILLKSLMQNDAKGMTMGLRPEM
jgi:hypothetical protein